MDFLKKLFGFSIGPVVGAILSFITIPITTYYISPEQYGKSSMFLTTQILLVSLIYFGFDQSFSREYHGYSDKKKLFQNAILFPLIVSVAVIIIFYIYRIELSIYLFGNTNYEKVAVSLGVLLFFTVIERFILMYVRMQEQAIVFSMFSVGIKFSILLLTIIYLLLGYRNFLVVVNSTIYGQMLFDFFLLYKYRELLNFINFSFDKILFIKMFKFGFPLMIAIFLTSFLSSSGRFFLGNFSTFFELGIFTAASKVAGLLSIIQSSFTSFWLPTSYRWNKENRSINDFLFISEGLCFVLSILLMLVIIFKNLVIVIISPKYMDSQYILPLMCLSPLLYTLSETVVLGISFSKKSYLNIYIGLLSVIPSIILNILLIPNYGTKGAAISQSVGFIIFYFLRGKYSEKTGYKLNNYKQKVLVLLMFIISFINLFDFKGVIIINILFFILFIIIQLPIIKKIMFYMKYANEMK